MKQIVSILLILLLSMGLLNRADRRVHAQAGEQIAVVGARGAQLYPTLAAAAEGDGATAPVAVVPGALLMIQGRSSDSQFLYVQTEARAEGWIAVGSLLVVNINALPVVADDVAVAAAPVGETAAEPVDTVGAAHSEPSDAENSESRTLQATPEPNAAFNAVDLADANTATAAITALVTLTDSRLNLRTGPSTAYPIAANAEPGSRWTVTGQTKAGDWLQLRSPAGDVEGWGLMRYLLIEGSGALPVIHESPRLLVATPTALSLTQVSNEPNSGAGQTLLPTPTVARVEATGKSGLSGLLAFQDRIGGTIYLYDLDRDLLTPLTNGIDPAISPDGQMVAFTRDGGAGGLYVINADGSGERRIYNDHPLLRSPSWQPDSQWIVFSRANGYDDCRVVRGSVCLPDSAIIESLPEELQGDAEVHNLVKGLPNQRTYHTSLARIAPDGSGYRDIPALDYAAAPDWNRSGIVYQSNAGIQRTADEPDVRSVEVANDPLTGYFHDPDWQPQRGDAWGRIVFHRKRGSHWQIYGVNPDGSGLAALTQPVTALVDELPSNVSPAWSPDGQHIIYLSNRNSIESAGAWHLWVMNADGSDQRMLPIDVAFEYTFSSEQMVSWAQPGAKE